MVGICIYTLRSSIWISPGALTGVSENTSGGGDVPAVNACAGVAGVSVAVAGGAGERGSERFDSAISASIKWQFRQEPIEGTCSRVELILC